MINRNIFATFIAFMVILIGSVLKKITKNPSLYISQNFSKYMSINYFRIGNQCFDKENCKILFANHRSSVDSIILFLLMKENYVCLARYAALLIPFVWYGAIYNQGLFFKRGSTKVTDLYKKVDNYFEKYPNKTLLVYPEGSRNTTNKTLPLKEGFIRYSFETKKKSQIVITLNNEQIFDEKKLKSGSNVDILYKFSEVIDPNDYQTYDDYKKKIIDCWNDQFNEIYQNYEKDINNQGFIKTTDELMKYDFDDNIPYFQQLMNILLTILIFSPLYFIILLFYYI